MLFYMSAIYTRNTQDWLRFVRDYTKDRHIYLTPQQKFISF